MHFLAEFLIAPVPHDAYVRDISKHFCLLPFLEKIEFLKKERNFRSAIWHEYPWIHSWYIYTAKILKLINYGNTYLWAH